MSRDFNAFQDSFSSKAHGSHLREKLHARADYTTNTLRINVPADDPVEMTIIHAFVSREEFMHGEWNVSLIHSAARLRVAAIDALYEILANDGNTEKLSWVQNQAYDVAGSIDAHIQPFKEAVDKLQILSVVAGDKPFLGSVEETFTEVFGDDGFERVKDNYPDATSFQERLLDEINKQEAFAEGRGKADHDGPSNLYVNPLYYFALDEIISKSQDDKQQSASEQILDQRAIAETIARVTLDIPYPVDPLNGEADHPSLQIDDIELPTITMEELNSQTGEAARYRITEDEYETYLLEHLEKVEDRDIKSQIREQTNTSKPSWLDAIFVSTLKAYDRIGGQSRFDGTDVEKLRQELSKEVHGVDITSTTTMLNKPTHLLEIPAKASADADEMDLINEPHEPLPKVLLEAFEQHGSFGAVIFSPTDGEDRYQLNFHALVKGDVEGRSDIPEHIDSYQGLWERYFLGKEMLNTIIKCRNQYATHLRKAFIDAHATYEELQATLNEYYETLEQEKQKSLDQISQNVTISEFAAVSGQKSDEGRKKEKKDLTDSSERENLMNKHMSELKLMKKKVDDWGPWPLRLVARTEDHIEFKEIEEFVSDEFEVLACPFCDLSVTEYCGEDECEYRGQIQSFNTQLSWLVDRRLDFEVSQ